MIIYLAVILLTPTFGQADRLFQELNFITPEAPSRELKKEKREEKKEEDEISLSQSAPERGPPPPPKKPSTGDFKVPRRRSR